MRLLMLVTVAVLRRVRVERVVVSLAVLLAGMSRVQAGNVLVRAVCVL